MIGKRYLEAKEEAKSATSSKERQKILSRARYYTNKKANKKLEKLVQELKREAGIPEGEEGCLEHVPLYEELLKISVCITRGPKSDCLIYTGDERFREKNERIYLHHWKPNFSNRWHFDLIQSMAGFMGKAYYCYDCDVGYHNKEHHSCTKRCTVCLNTKCEINDRLAMRCEDCHRTCRSRECYQRHKSKPSDDGVSLCNQKYKCPSCDVTLRDKHRPRKNHLCSETYCRNCQQWFANQDEDSRHLCHMRALKAEPPIEKFIFYDFESTQESGRHIPNMFPLLTRTPSRR